MSPFSATIDLSPWVTSRDGLLEKLRPPTIGDVVGRRIALTYIPLMFRRGGDPAWEKPKFRSGQPLRDTGNLANSFGYRTVPTGAEVYTTVIYAGVQSRGDTIRAKNASGLLWWANRDVLGPSEARVLTVAKAMKKYGLHRPYKKGEKKGGKRAAVIVDKFGTPYFFGKAEVKLTPRPILDPTPAMTADVSTTLEAFLMGAGS